MNDPNQEYISFLRSLFKGREDVFAIRWEKNGKSGYMPSYTYDPFHFRIHKQNGGTFQNYSHKTYLPLTDNELQKHLEGQQQIGIYPLQKDNASWFLVADFDKENWQKEAVSFLNSCEKLNIPAYLERSRSGNGGHVWIFFEKPFPAIKSRKIFISILEKLGIFSLFDKSSSFDRLFPNQDFLSGKGLGNLIALPFFKPSIEKGNSCFINPNTFEQFENQLSFLQNIKRVSIEHLEGLYQKEISNSETKVIIKSKNLQISLDNIVKISRFGLPQILINFLKEELNFANTEFFVKKQSGRNTFGTNRYFKLVAETENEVLIPRGFIGKLIRFCKENSINHEFSDMRLKKLSVNYEFNATLRNHQQKAIEAVEKKDFGVIVAPPNSGKTLVGLKIISEKKQPALIIVHRRQLLEQWCERIESFLGIPKREIGIIGSGKMKIGKQITVATIQSLPKYLEDIVERFGTIIIDECHHIPAESFRNTIEKLKTFYLYGLTSTPFRKYNDGKIIFTHIGEIITQIKPEDVENFKPTEIVIRKTLLDVHFNSKTDSFETLSKILIHDTNRNRLILNDVERELDKGKKAVVITERKEHIDSLNLFLKQFYEVVTLSGDDSENSRKSKWQNLHQGNFQVVITTGQYFGEGTDLSSINSLFLVYPFSFEGKMIQYIGRVQRSEINPIIYDYCDHKIDCLNKLFLKRNTYYRKITRKATLFDDIKEELTPIDSTKIFENKIKVAIEDLEFHYRSVAFKYPIQEMNATFEFHIENMEIRPELEVLKPYFVKVLKSRTINVEISAEFERGKLIAQNAISSDIERINEEIVEGVKIQFLNKELIGRNKFHEKNVLTAEELQNQEKLFNDAEQILQQILVNRNYKHSAHVLFLAEKHKSQIMKIRFVLQPFSFVFLLAGKDHHYIVLETLDTEEATYIWKTGKSKTSVINAVMKIDNQLTFIRENGRQMYLETNPKDFSRILHDYSDDKKGFINWKSQLEEILL